MLFLKSTLLTILNSGRLTLVLQDMYVLRRGCFPLKKMDGKNLYMKNLSTFKVLNVRKVILKMISGKLVTLNNVLHAADIRKNLLYG